MPNLCLDPFLLACPPPETTIIEFEDFIRNIIIWHEELRNISWAEVYLTEKTEEVLAETNSYPTWESIQYLIRKFSIDYANTQDICRITQSLLSRITYIEKHLGIKEILIENKQSKPSDHLTGRHNLFKDYHDRLLIMMSLSCFFNRKEEKDHILVTRNLKKNNMLLKIFGKIVDFEFYEPTRTIHTPYIAKGTFPACININGLHSTLDPVSIWKKDSSFRVCNKALVVYIYQNFGLDDIQNNWSFGHTFFESARDLEFCNDDRKIKRLLRACAETILERNLRHIHELRIGPGPAAAQRKRHNEEGAWRRDIDREYHLHYWQTRQGPEFASVVVHDDMRIPE